MGLFTIVLQKFEISSTKHDSVFLLKISNSAEKIRNKLDKYTNIWYKNKSDILFEVKR